MSLGTIGSRLREAREKLGKDQSEFAKELGIPRNSLHRYEIDDQVPGGKLLSKIAEIGLDVVYILRGGDGLKVEITTIEMELIYNYRRSHKDVKRGVGALLKETAAQGEDK